MLRKELVIGFLVAGFATVLVPTWVRQSLFLTGHGFWSSLENALLGPLLAILAFVCSVGNVPLAAALWVGGISFGGVIAFVFADLITLLDHLRADQTCCANYGYLRQVQDLCLESWDGEPTTAVNGLRSPPNLALPHS